MFSVNRNTAPVLLASRLGLLVQVLMLRLHRPQDLTRVAGCGSRNFGRVTLAASCEPRAACNTNRNTCRVTHVKVKVSGN